MKTKKEITSEFYCSSIDHILLPLKEMGVKYRTERFFSNFWGIRVIVEKPKGKESWEKISRIERILQK